MSKVLFINPNKWGRGITAIWIPAHAAALRSAGHTVDLFDATFFAEWTVDEVGYNTANAQYQPTDYRSHVAYDEGSVVDALQAKVDAFEPDIIFWSALSSHIHGEGEYVNIQYGYELVEAVKTDALKVTAGLQATASPADVFARLPNIDVLIRGESELPLAEIATRLGEAGRSAIRGVSGTAVQGEGGEIVSASPQPILSDLDVLGPYDYGLFDPQTFWRPYNGDVVRAVDYELSRGCIYACEYCVETVVQSYYGFEEITRTGAIRRAKDYLRAKSPQRIFEEMMTLHRDHGIELFRCQDTNFLTIDRLVLAGLADLFDEEKPTFKLYIETRPEGIRPQTIELLKRLNVDGVGMGIELSTEDFREDKLRRFASQEKIVTAFDLLQKVGIKRTSYNIIGLPEQDEASVLETIKFNQLIDADNMTVAFYSPYQGTAQQKKAKELGYFDEYEYHVDGQLRTMSNDADIDPETLVFYKAYFSRLVTEGLDNLARFKEEFASERRGAVVGTAGVGASQPQNVGAGQGR